MKYSQIRKEYQSKYGLHSVFVDAYTCMLSPFVTKLALKCGWKPNTVTIGMILCGILGAFLFALPLTATKILGIVFIHLWFIFDCSDGEVARITKTFSQYGKEIDYMAHAINHPLFMFAFTITLYQWDLLNKALLIIMFLIVISDFLIRMNYTFLHIESLKETAQKNQNVTNDNKIKKVIYFAINFFVQLPNFCLIFPIVLLLSTYIAKIYLYMTVLIACIYAIYITIKWIRKVHYI